MIIFYAGFYNLNEDYLKKIEDKIKDLHILKSYFYKSELDNFMKKKEEYERGDRNASGSKSASGEIADVDDRG